VSYHFSVECWQLKLGKKEGHEDFFGDTLLENITLEQGKLSVDRTAESSDLYRYFGLARVRFRDGTVVASQALPVSDKPARCF
jgi:hypothetical protein